MKLEHAVFTIFGIRNAENPLRLLGISRWDGKVLSIETALRVRLAQIISHPNRHGEEAKMVRVAIKKAARSLRKRCLEHEDKPVVVQEVVHEMTPLDHSIIAVLVSEGGWNRQSRSRLVGVAAAYGLTVGGLLRILSALADSARSGKGPLSRASRNTVVPDRSWATLPTPKKRQSVLDELMDEAASRFLPEFKEQTPAAVIKLSFLFGLLTIVAIVLGLVVIKSADERANRILLVNNDLLRTTASNTSTQDMLKQQVVSPFEVYPTFQENIFTSEIGMLVDFASEVPRKLIKLKDTIELSGVRGAGVSKEILEDWNVSIQTISEVWPFLDQGLQEEVGELIVHTISSSQRIPGLPATLLASFEVENNRLLLTGSMSIMQPPWFLGELARIVCSSKVMHSIKKQARAASSSFLLNCDVQETRRKAIVRTGLQLVKNTELDPLAFLLWEQWLAMVNREEVMAVADSLRAQMVRALLRSDVDLARSSHTRKVIGRFIKEIDWVRTTQMRDALLSFYEDESISEIDLWAMSNMFADAGNIPWFISEHIVNISDNSDRRLKIANDLRRVWPQTSTQNVGTHRLILPAGFDPNLIGVWKELILLCKDKSKSSASQFALSRRLNEIAAALWLGRPSRAWQLVDNIDQASVLKEDPPRVDGGRSSGQLIKRFKNTNRDSGEMLKFLNYLRSTNYSSLHLSDATVLARAALFYGDGEISNQAVELICERFSESPEVAIALVNILSSRSKTTEVESLVAYLSDEILPARHDSLWLGRARRAFVEHALSVNHTELKDLDHSVLIAAVSAMGESLLVDPTRLRPTHESTIEEAYTRLLEAWSHRLGNIQSTKQQMPTFGKSKVLATHLQKQLQYLQQIQQLETQWSGLHRDQVESQSIAEAPTLLDQIREAEFASLIVWNRMIDRALDEYNKLKENQ